MAYIPNATDPTEPVESQTVESAALEFRTLKASVPVQIAASTAAEAALRVAGDLANHNEIMEVELTLQNEIAALTVGDIDGVLVRATSITGSAIVPAGTTTERDVSPEAGYIRWNSTLNQYEGYTGSTWSAIGGGATGAPGNNVFVENDQIVTGNYTLTTGKNAMTAGPITIDDGVTVTIPTDSTWSII